MSTPESNSEVTSDSDSVPTPKPTPVPTPVSTPELTPEPTQVPVQESIPESTPEPTPVPTPVSTSELTPEPTQVPVQESIPESTPEPTPAPTPVSTPESNSESNSEITSKSDLVPTPILAPEPTQESTPEPTFETTQNSMDSGVSFFEKVSDCVGSLWNSAKNNVNTWWKNKKENDLRELYEGVQLEKNLTKQCKAIDSAGTVVYNCGTFSEDTCCKYMDANGKMKYDVLREGLPVKKYTTIGLGGATVIFGGAVIWKYFTLK